MPTIVRLSVRREKLWTQRVAGRKFWSCEVTETEYSPRHLIKWTPFNTYRNGACSSSYVAWPHPSGLSSNVTSSKRSPLIVEGFPSPPPSYSILHHLNSSLEALITICNSHFTYLSTCSLAVSLTRNVSFLRAGVWSVLFALNITLPSAVPSASAYPINNLKGVWRTSGNFWLL